jgi:hypothetical protein
MASPPGDDDSGKDRDAIREQVAALRTRAKSEARPIVESMLSELTQIHADLTDLFAAASARNLGTGEIEQGLREIEDIRAACVRAIAEDDAGQ